MIRQKPVYCATNPCLYRQIVTNCFFVTR